MNIHIACITGGISLIPGECVFSPARTNPTIIKRSTGNRFDAVDIWDYIVEMLAFCVNEKLEGVEGAEMVVKVEAV